MQELAIQDKDEQLRRLIHLGKARGYLLHDEVTDIFPIEHRATEEIDELFSVLERENIEIYEDVAAATASHHSLAVSEDALAHQEEPAPAEELEIEERAPLPDRYNDPVRTYLREMGVVPLLTREREVAIAKRIERGQMIVLKTISRSPIVLKDLITTGRGLRDGSRTIKDVIRFEDEELAPERIEAKTRATLSVIGKIEKLYATATQQALRLRSIAKSTARVYLRARP